jgi:hypothetical protein
MKSRYLDLSLHNILLLLGFIAFFLNVIPTFAIGFYQDDYKSYFDVCQSLGWNIQETITTNQLNAGYRPLLFLDRILLYQAFGENVILFRIYLSAIHLIFGIILYVFIKKLTQNSISAASALFLYFAFNLTRQTIYSLVAQSYSDLIIVLVMLIMLSGILDNKFNNTRIILIAFLVILGLGLKENAFSLMGLIPFIIILYYRKIERQKIWLTLASLVLISVTYLYFYVQGTKNASRTTVQTTSLNLGDFVDVLKGIIFSTLAPFMNLYNQLRGGLNVPLFYSLIILISAIFFLLLYVLISKNAKEVLKANWQYFLKLVAITFVANSIVLALYVFNPYFENRMLIVSFWIGTGLWGIIFSKFIEAEFNIPKQIKMSSLLLVTGLLILLVPAIGTPISKNIKEEYEATNELKRISKCMVDNGVDTLVMRGFSTSSLIRSGNSKGIVRFVSNRKINIIEDTSQVMQSEYKYPVILYTTESNKMFKVLGEPKCE